MDVKSHLLFSLGCRFGTILIDLESRRVVDLLPDNERLLLLLAQ